MTDYTPYQRKIIDRYYDHRDEIMLGKLQEIVTELYLAEGERKLDQLWKQAGKAMKALKIPQPIHDHILATRKADVLARNVRDWLDHVRKGPA